MKHVLILLLCIAMLFVVGCQKEEQPQWSEFYTKDGYVHHTQITAVLNTKKLTEPISELSYTLYDNSDFGIGIDYYTDTNDHRTHRLEIYENGEWTEAPHSGDTMTDKGSLYTPDPDPAAHRKFDFTMKLRQEDGHATIRYNPLQHGFYRLIVTYTLNTDDPDVTIPKRQHGYVLYFNVM